VGVEVKIPSSIKVSGHVYKVICPYAFTERGDRCGACDNDLHVIQIDDKDQWSHVHKPESEVAVTFLHEVLHACDHVTGHKIFEGEEGENKIGALSQSLFQVLRDNKLRFDEE
jgi:hypothetical protein